MSPKLPNYSEIALQNILRASINPSSVMTKVLLELIALQLGSKALAATCEELLCVQPVDNSIVLCLLQGCPQDVKSQDRDGQPSRPRRDSDVSFFQTLKTETHSVLRVLSIDNPPALCFACCTSVVIYLQLVRTFVSNVYLAVRLCMLWQLVSAACL